MDDSLLIWTPEVTQVGTLLKRRSGKQSVTVRSRDEDFFVDYFAGVERNMLRFKLGSGLLGVGLTALTLSWRRILRRPPTAAKWTLPRTTAGVAALAALAGSYMASTVEGVAETSRTRGVGLRCVAFCVAEDAIEHMAGAAEGRKVDKQSLTKSGQQNTMSSSGQGMNDHFDEALQRHQLCWSGDTPEAHYFSLESSEGKTLFGGEGLDPLRTLRELGLPPESMTWIRRFVAAEGELQKSKKERERQQRRDKDRWSAVFAERGLDVGSLIIWKIPILKSNDSENANGVTSPSTSIRPVDDGLPTSDTVTQHKQKHFKWWWPPSWFYTSKKQQPDGVDSEAAIHKLEGTSRMEQTHRAGEGLERGTLLLVGVLEGESQYRTVDNPQASLWERVLDPAPSVSRRGVPLPPWRVVRAELYAGVELREVPPFNPWADDPRLSPVCQDADVEIIYEEEPTACPHRESE